MHQIMRALMAGSIDYAGLFPPAGLPLATAAADYVRYAGETDAWMLGKFVCPAGRLAELAPLLPAGRTWNLSALGRGGDTVTAWLDGLTQDLALVTACPHAVASFEARLPTEAFTTPGELARCLESFQMANLDLFVEVPAGPGYLDRAHAVLEALKGRAHVGFKLRCGGLEATAFPAVRTVADVLRSAFKAQVPLKATAGLHHPLRRFDEKLQAWMHGFVNLFVAALLARLPQATSEDRIAALDTREASAFRIGDSLLSWRTFAWNTATVTEMRQKQVLSFGSCSFDEPRDDLRQLDWLPRAGGG